ncbi:hypothetical protein BYT27DRAFT_7221070 [Phlegmacium glaucopus]|nr:hypothetical protein BYT27DRAFT_7221070 [Phlegmacium glaucopus]
MSSRDPSAKQSSVASLASLEYLQSQRRGSITDPARHAVKLNTNYRDLSSGSSSLHQESPTSRSHISDPRPSSPYIFGDATTSQQEHSSQLRKLLHSPSSEHVSHRPTSHDSHPSSRNYTGSDQMNIDRDNDRHPFPKRRSIREPNFDFSMRRHSIAVGQNSVTLPHLASTLHGIKRKMSGDRAVFSPVGEDLDPQLVGPGVPSTMDIDADAPAPKRRGSTIDTQRIAQLSLNDRRNSVDSRGGQWVSNDRRDSAPSLFHTVPGISSLVSSNFDPPNPQQSRVPSSMATFAWPVSPQSDVTNHSTIQNDSTYSARQFELPSQLNMVPPLNYTADRRMSVPDNLTNPTPTRPLRSRSRPPSRQNTDPQSSGQEEPSSASSPNASGKLGKEGGITPYSRSPELRVSHKLAERKRRKEMKDLFDELRDQLPADRGMKASKWEILSKAIDFVMQLKRSHQEMAQELDMLRQQANGSRQENISGFPPGGPPLGHTSYCPPVVGPYPPSIMHPHQPPSHSDSRSISTQDMFPQPLNSSLQNGHLSRIEGPPT